MKTNIHLGRKKDIIIVAGKNISPEDVEDAANEVTGVIPGRVVAFGMEDPSSGTEQVCVIAETEETAGRGLKVSAGRSGKPGYASTWRSPGSTLFRPDG